MTRHTVVSNCFVVTLYTHAIFWQYNIWTFLVSLLCLFFIRRLKSLWQTLRNTSTWSLIYRCKYGCTFTDLSDIILSINILLLHPMTLTNHKCHCTHSALILMRALFTRIRTISFIICLLRLIVLWSWRSFEPRISRSSWEIDLIRWSSISPLFCIVVIKSVILSMTKMSKDVNIYARIPFASASFFSVQFAQWLFHLRFKYTWSFRCLYCSLYQWANTKIFRCEWILQCIHSICEVFFYNISLSFLQIMHLSYEHVYCYLYFHVSSVILIDSISTHFSLNHSILTGLHLFLIYLCNVLFYMLHIGIVFCPFIPSRISSVIHSFFFVYFPLEWSLLLMLI